MPNIESSLLVEDPKVVEMLLSQLRDTAQAGPS